MQDPRTYEPLMPMRERCSSGGWVAVLEAVLEVMLLSKVRLISIDRCKAAASPLFCWVRSTFDAYSLQPVRVH